MATKIKLMRLGKMRAPYYRIVVADARTKRQGRVIETIGKYHPKSDPSFIEVDSPRAQYWLGVGALPTEPVAAIFKVTGDWQLFKGEPAPPPMRTVAPRSDKRALFEAAAKEGLPATEAAAASAPVKKAAVRPRKTAAKATEEEVAPAEAEVAVAEVAVAEAEVAPAEAEVAVAEVAPAEAEVAVGEQPEA